MTRLLFATALTFALASAQSLTEAAIAATGGSAAGVAGKSVSDNVERIFGLLSGPKALAAETPRSPGSKTAAPAAAGPVFSGPMGSSSSGTPGRRSAAVRTGVADLHYPASNSVRAPSREILAGIAEGTRRDDLIALTGAPACRILMGEGAHVVELYNYAVNGETIASVRLTDGEVTTVHVTSRQ